MCIQSNTTVSFIPLVATCFGHHQANTTQNLKLFEIICSIGLMMVEMTEICCH
jgi:hypothetical protein